MRSTPVVVLAVGLSLVGVADWARAEDLKINLIREDAYASRRMQVFKKSGDKLSGADTIESFDAESNSFTMGTVTGETITVAVTDLEKIEFQQALLRQNPVAQQGWFEVAAQPGATLMYKVNLDAIKIQSGDLILPAAVLPTTISPAGTPAVPTPQHGGRLTTRKIVEAKKLTWDPPSKSFRLEVQEVVYSREEYGGSGPSGIRK
jgi:hypothetical protein